MSIDALNHPALLAMRGEQKKICEIKYENYRRSKFGPFCLLAQGTPLSPSITQKQIQIGGGIIRCVFPIHGTSPKDCALLKAETEMH